MSRNDLPLFNMDLPEHRKLVVDYVKGLRGIIRLEVTRPRKSKTLSQLAYIWGVVYPTLAAALADAWGEAFDSDRAHNVLKGMFLSRPVVNRHTGDEVASEPRSLADLTVDECSAYIEALINFGASLGCSIPPPAHFETAGIQ
jgi:hypothetical protein